jgi:hypothetical protein
MANPIMQRAVHELMSPMGEPAPHSGVKSVKRGRRGHQPVIGLLDNSKPNVAFFLAALEERILAAGAGYTTFNFAKPRSAAPCPDLDLLAERCDLVINAVAD